MAYGSGGGGSSSGGGGDGYGGDDGSFVKQKDGIIAPKGFHYMPNGKLMSDADHIAMFGYIDKTITNLTFDATDIGYDGEAKSFSVSGDNGAIFSVEISDDATIPNYYNFNTGLFSTTKPTLKKIQLQGIYLFEVNFPTIEFKDTTCDYNNDPTIAHDDDDGKIQAGMTVTGTGIPAGATVASITSDTAFELSASTTGGAVTNGTLTFGGLLKKYTIKVHTHISENIKTKHVSSSVARFVDDTVDHNNSTGSDSDVLTKILYQDIKKYLYLSCIAPSLYAASADTVDGAVSSSNRIVIDGDPTDSNITRVGDKVTGTGIAASIHALVTKINPDGDNVKEIETSIADSIGDGVAITFTPPFNGMTPHGTDSTTGRYEAEVSSGKGITASFTISLVAQVGRTFTIDRIPTVEDLCAFTTVEFATGPLQIPGEDTSSGSLYYRWPVINISNLSEGMSIDPARSGAGINTIKPSKISKYLTTVTAKEVIDNRHSVDIIDLVLDDVSVVGVDQAASDGSGTFAPVTAIDRNGKVTAQIGNVTFNKQQPEPLKSDDSVRIFANGPEQIKTMTGVDVALSNVKVTPTQISTTTSGSVSASATIPLTEVSHVSTASIIRGVGINSAVANPAVTVKAALSGGANITASSAQTLESGQTLFFDGASNIVTITGDITVSNMAITDTTLYFDVERFLTSI